MSYFIRLVFTTGIFWYLFDLILQYPFHMAVLFLVFYSSTYLTSLPQMFRRSSTPRFVSVPETPAASEFKYLKGKMNQIEEKTDGIQKKVEELEIMFKSMAFGKDLWSQYHCMLKKINIWNIRISTASKIVLSHCYLV